MPAEVEEQNLEGSCTATKDDTQAALESIAKCIVSPDTITTVTREGKAAMKRPGSSTHLKYLDQWRDSERYTKLEYSDRTLKDTREKAESAKQSAVSLLKLIEKLEGERRSTCEAYNIPEDSPSRSAEDINADTIRYTFFTILLYPS